MNDWSRKTVAELRQVAQWLLRQGKITGKTAREIAFMNKENLISLLNVHEITNGEIVMPKEPITTEPVTAEPEPVAPLTSAFTGEPITAPPIAREPEPTEPEPTEPEPVKITKDDNLAKILATVLQDYIKPGLDVQGVKDILKAELEKFDVVEKMREVERYLNDRAAVIEKELAEKLLNLTPIKVELPSGEVKNIGLQHKVFESVFKLACLRQNVWLVGPSGSGKTHLVESIAKALDLKFEAISVGLQTSKTDLFGYTDAHGNYVETAFFRCYKNGGVFLLDEVDNGNANVLAMINAATSNSLCGFPVGMVAKHKDFIFMAAANTYGLGANAVYVGRNQIDGATRNRFAFISVDYDETLENALTPNKAWLARVRRIRRAIDDLKEKVIASPRASILGSAAIECGFSIDTVMEMYIFQGVNKDVKDKILSRSL